MAYNSLYVASTQWSFDGTNGAHTEIEKFTLDESGLHFTSDGKVDGFLTGVESPLHEHDGYLHVVTVSSQDSSTNVYVLAQQDDELDLVGSLTGIAPNEQLYSVRFDEDMAYLVTAESPAFFAIPVDPLFTINLSDPTKPVMEGQLIVPGYSNYLQLIDGDKFLISVGQSDISNPNNLAISVYDVRDPKSPQMVDRFTFPQTRFMGDHQSIKYLPETRTLSLAVSQMNTLSSNWLIFGIGNDHKIRIENSVPFVMTFSRSMQIGEILVGIGQGEIKALPINDLSVSPISVESADYQNPIFHPWLPNDPAIPVNLIISPILNLQSQHAVAGKTTSVSIGSMVGEGFKLVSAYVEGNGGEAAISDEGMSLMFSPGRSVNGTQVVHYVLEDSRGVSHENQVEFNVEPWSWSNASNALDCNGDGEIRPMDALLTINLLDKHGPMTIEALDALVSSSAIEDLFQYDSNEDGMISAVDALLVINELNRQQEAASSSRMMQPVADASSIDQSESLESLLAGPYYYDPELDKIRK
ncbi:MAG: beta-propeller domain-containing protein [Pirellulales bacterium]